MLSSNSPLVGIFTPNMIPLTERGAINQGELRRYINWLIERGVHGLYPNGSTSEFVRFSSEERRTIIQVTCEQADGRVPVLAGATEANAAETLQRCEEYLTYGARAVAIVAPYYYKLSPEAVFAYFDEIAAHTPIDVVLYNIPMLANPIDVVTITRLAHRQRVIGIKDSSGDIGQMIRLMAAIRHIRPEFAFMTGWEPALLPMLSIGCCGATLASSGIVPELTRSLFENAREGAMAENLELQISLTRLFDAVMIAADFPEGVRAAVACRGFEMGPSRQPRGQDGIETNRIQRLIDDALNACCQVPC